MRRSRCIAMPASAEHLRGASLAGYTCSEAVVAAGDRDVAENVRAKSIVARGVSVVAISDAGGSWSE